jgi:hypothetical protein
MRLWRSLTGFNRFKFAVTLVSGYLKRTRDILKHPVTFRIGHALHAMVLDQLGHVPYVRRDIGLIAPIDMGRDLNGLSF